jgi:hypothetical protein
MILSPVADKIPSSYRTFSPSLSEVRLERRIVTFSGFKVTGNGRQVYVIKRILAAHFLPPGPDTRRARGGYLIQPMYDVIQDNDSIPFFSATPLTNYPARPGLDVRSKPSLPSVVEPTQTTAASYARSASERATPSELRNGTTAAAILIFHP